MQERTKTHSRFLLLVLMVVSVLLNAQHFGIESYYYHYPKHNDLFIKSLVLTETGPSCLIQFASDLEKLDSILIAMDSSRFESLSQFANSIPGGKNPERLKFQPLDIRSSFHVDFVNDGKPDIQRRDIQLMMKSGLSKKIYNLALTYYPTAFYAAANSSVVGRIIVTSADLPMSKTSISDWITVSPSTADIEYAQKKMGKENE